ncbi:MAG TPA: cytochrome c [Rhodobacteraceae bacterium]|nr:cytochrome c [Paracoccaceae bacterium]
MEIIKQKLIPILIIAVLAGGVAVIVTRNSSNGSAAMVKVTVPEFTPVAARGRDLFNANCAACHGKNAGGSENGPPLVHQIYNPGHHADGAFVLAARNGVRAHHWRFGNMPPVPTVTQPEVMMIVRYIRELQLANGITTRPHVM